MAITVLVVDDSRFFRERITDILNRSKIIRVVAVASDGAEAVEMAAKHSPDVITMDYEMPRMDGITAVRHIMARKPIPILMFSSLTYEGARVTLDALEAGALDFLPKSFDMVKEGHRQGGQILISRVQAIYNAGHKREPVTANTSSKPSLDSSNSSGSSNRRERTNNPIAKSTPEDRSVVAKTNRGQARGATHTRAPKRYKVLLIGASTGGPVALLKVLQKFPANFPLPILLIQHMPPAFTKAFAERLNNNCAIKVNEAFDGQTLEAGRAILAPGDMQMLVSHGAIKLLKGDDRIQYKPSVDVSFGSAAKSYSANVLAVVLTGMGHDGREGARLLKRAGAKVWNQDAQTSVVYGMPAAVKKAGLSDEEIPIESMGKRIVEEVMGGPT